MALPIPCCLPKFGTNFAGPKRPALLRTKTSPSQTLQLLSAWDQGQLDSLLKASWALLLQRYTGLEDICFGYQPIGVDGDFHDATSLSDIQNNPLIFNLTIAEDDSIHTVRRNAEGKNAEKCETSPSRHNHTLFNTVLMLRNCRGPSSDARAPPVQPALAIPLPEECRVRLHVKLLQEDIGIFLEYWNHDTSMEHMKSIADYFEQILARVLSEDDSPAKDLNHFSDRDWSRVCKFNAVLPEAHDRCIHEVINEQVLLRPDDEAVCAWDGSLTFRDLDLLSSQVAYHLYEQGVRPETCVALCFDKSKWNVVAMLGVLKAGGAFVPLDPTHPTPRLQSLVHAVKAKVMLCSRNRAAALSAVAETLVPLDQDAIDDFAVSTGETRQLPQVQGCNAAYVIFTSGSTGEPKGTMLEHRAYVSGAIAHAPRHNMYSTSRVLQFASHTFDASLVEILTTLLQGGCVCIPSEEERLSDIVKVIKELRVTHAILTPSFIEFVDSSQVPGLNTLVLAGEAMSTGQLETWSSKITLINAYGPTESSVAAVINSKVTPSSDCRDIGLPVGVRCWLVDPDSHDQLVPVGCPGELILEGPTLARCYLNNPQKTNEAFIYNPAWMKRDGATQEDRRVYKTGRKDTQVKFHGQRLELGEIENHLAADQTIKHCLTFLSKSGFSTGRLVAVISLSVHFENQSDPDATPLRLLEPSKKAPIVSEVRERLSALLPTYMIPSVWLCVEALPLLASGKLDRKATAKWISSMAEDPDLQHMQASSDLTDESMYPVNTTEGQLASIWSRVLNIPRNQIGLDKGFLNLGGDSIAAITCLGYCKKQGMGLTVQEVLHSKSIRELATRVKKVDQSIVYEEKIDEPFDLSPIQKLHFMVRSEGQGHFNQSIIIRLNQHIDEHDIKRAIETIVSRHSMLRARLVESGSGLQQRITEDVTGSYHWQTHDNNSQTEVDQAVANSQACIDAFVGPVLAVDLFYENGNARLLSLVAHHLVVDIVSWRIILEDLEDLITNPDQPTSQSGSLPFQNWCQIQADHCQPEAAKIVDLPDVSAPDFAYWGLENHSTTYGDVDCETFELDSDITRSILMECHQGLGTEPIDVFLAALLHSFGQTFKDRSLPVIYNEGHGREAWESAIDISRTVGWFTTLYPILLSALPAEDATETVVRVKDLRRRVSDNGRQDFARRMLTTREDGTFMHHSPMEISFNYVGQHRDLQRTDGLFQLMDQMAGETGRGGGAADFGANTPRFALFEISAMVVHGNLRFIFSFNGNMQHQTAIREWVKCCHTLLQSLGGQLQSLSPRPTLSSFPLLTLTYDELDTMVSKKLPSVGIDSLDSVEDVYPCSPMQQGILLSRSRDTSLYAVHDTFEVKGSGIKPDVNRLTFAWQKVVAHHSMLRTVFVEGLTSHDLYCQVVLKSFDSCPSYVECANDEDVLSTLDKQQPAIYNDKEPPHRFTVCQTASGKIFCRLELSHAAMDGTSISIIVRDLQLAYQGKLEDQRPQFKEYVHYLQETSQEASIGYWRKYLSDVKPCHFPMLNDGNASERRLRTMRLNIATFKDLQTVCEANSLTLSTAFNTAWGLTVRSFCDSDDVSFTYPTSLRDVPVEGIDSVVGPVINTLTCRIKFPKGALLKDILSKVQDDNMENLPYRQLSLIEIQQALKLSSALSNTAFSYRKLPSARSVSREMIQLSEVGTIHDPAEAPIFVNVEATEEDARVDLNYWTDFLSEGQAENVANTFLKSLEDIVHRFGDEVHQIDNFSETNKQQITLWNNKTPEAVDKCIHEMVDEHAKSNPDAVAIKIWDGSLTYGKVNELSSLLATYLAKLGVGSGDVVPIDFTRSVWQIVAILAVFKAGGICVPIEKNSQQDFDTWIADNGCQVALATPSRAQLLEGIVPYAIPVGRSLFQYLPETHGVFNSPAQTSNDAYVVYSAENSKAIVLDHRAVSTRAKTFASTLGLNNETKMLQHALYTSDMFLQEVFGTFASGGCVCIPSDDGSSHLPRAINTLQANCVSLPPSSVLALQPAEVPGVKLLALWGESLTDNLFGIWSKKVQLHTLYGAPECSSVSIHSSKAQLSDGLPVIGSSAGCVSWLVDPCNHDLLVPVGCVGELLIEGPGLSRGYFDNEELTRRSFIENPKWRCEYNQPAHDDDEEQGSGKPTYRLFKTGDLARYNSDGTLVYVGKKDRGTHWQQQAAAIQLEKRISTPSTTGAHCVVEALSKEGDKSVGGSFAVFVFNGNVESKTAEPQLFGQMTPEIHESMTKLHVQLSGLSASQIPKFYFPMIKMPLYSSGKLNRQALRDEAERSSEASRSRYDIRGFNDFWRAEFSNSTASPEFPPPPALSAASRSAPVSKEATKSVQISWCDSIKSRHLGVRSALLSAWALTVHGYTGSNDVVFGESLDDSEDVVPRRFQIDNAFTVTDLLDRTVDHLTAAKPHQWTGLQRIQSLNADTARACKFRNLLSICHMRGQQQTSQLERSEASVTDKDEADAYPLAVCCILDDVSMQVVARYDETTLFTTQAEQLMDQLVACIGLLNTESSMSKTIGDLSSDNGNFCSFSHDEAYWTNYAEEIELQCLEHLPAGTQTSVEIVMPEAESMAKCPAVFFTVGGHDIPDMAKGELILPMTESVAGLIKSLHNSISVSLPPAMLPKLYFPMRHLPVGTTAKVDRKELRAMVDTLSKEDLKPYVVFNVGTQSVSEVEMEGTEGSLQGLWEKALNLAPGSLSPEDNFFGLGGDSFSAMKLVTAATSLGISLSVADIYKTPVFKDMAKNCGALETQPDIPTVEPFTLLPASLSREEIMEEVVSQCGVDRQQISDIYPCSPVQEGLLTLSIKQSGAYVARPVFQLAEGADLQKFKAAWQMTVDEMDILRTRIVHTESANFVQAVLTSTTISWDFATDFDSLAGGTIDLAKNNGGMMTGYGIVESEVSSARYFVWTVHHSLYDGWSLGQVLRRVEEIYSKSSKPTSTLPYKLFINHLMAKDDALSDEFWKTHLAGLSAYPFPPNKPSPDAIRVGNRHHSSVEVSRASSSPNLTIPEIIRAAWAMVVSVHTGSGDVCFAETLMGRNIDMAGATEIAGPVLTTIPTRIAVDNELPVIQYLQNVRQLTTSMITHQHSGLQRIRKLSSDAALACESQNLLVIQSNEGQLNDSIWEPKHNLTEGDFFTHPIVVECKIDESRVSVTLHHDELVFDSWQAEMLIGQFGFVLEQLFAVSVDDARKVGELEVSSPHDKEEISSWNSHSLTCVDRCVHHIIEEKASNRPQAPAICSWDGQLSYQELYQLASSFAVYLNSRGIGPETLVPICMDKSMWAVVTILGVLIAGGAFVPLDPAHPTSRHKEILAEVEARVVLCSPKYHNRYTGAVKAIVPVSKETIKAYCALTTKDKGSDSVEPSNMAFAIFTSGSTGRAKGIIINHRALSSSGMAFGPMVNLDENSRAFQFASLTFDAAVMEVLVTLMHGGCVCIPSEDERLNDVAGAIRRMEVSWSFLTPSIASILEPSSVPSLKTLVCGGEKMSREVITKWAHRVNLMNGYGPTETTIFAVINTDVASNPDPACIGYGIPCTLTWVVDPDDHNKLTPLGAVGELALEGPALAREYLKNPTKTAEAFVDEPTWIKNFPSSLPSPRRIYKTGDLVKYNPDGTVEYIGRKDHQVKLHGQRMELGEIEHRLYEDPRVRHAVVILPMNGPLKKRLVTVMSLNSVAAEKSIISDNSCELIARTKSMQSAYQELVDIQKSLETQLPVYMVPKAWALIKQLPMLVSGKLDRKRITAWLEQVDSVSCDRIMGANYSTKPGEVEEEEIEQEEVEQKEEDQEASVQLIRDIFSQVLNLPPQKINPERSFVSLGGDSITGMAVISRARKHGLTLTLHNVLQSKSAKELALTGEMKVTTVRKEEKSGEQFGLAPIQRLLFQSADSFRDSSRFNQSMTVRVTRKIQPKEMDRAVRAVVEQHSMFRARLFKSNGEWQQKITDDVDGSYRFRHHTVGQENEILPLIAESQRAVDVVNGLVVAADLFEVSGMQILFLVASHICVDMVSWRIVLQDIQDLLDGGSLSTEKPLSFQAWCNLQHEESKKTKGSIQIPFSIQPPNLSYWGMDQSQNLYGHVKMESFTVDAAATTQILEACQKVLRTEAIEVILSAVIYSFRRTFTDREVPTIYNEGHGRETWDDSIDLSRTVGWFTTMCPLYAGDGSDLLDTLKRVKDTRRQLSSKSRPYFAESLLHPADKAANNFPVPLEILFNYLGQLQQLERSDSIFQHYGDAYNAETFEVAGDMGSETPRFALFEISALIIKDKIQVSYIYNRHMQHEQKIHGWISECKRVLEEDMLRLGGLAPEPTLNDYPLLPMTYEGLHSMVKSTFPKFGIESWDQVEDVYPCSPVQEGILLSQLRDPKGYLFHVVFEVLHSEGSAVDVKKLRKAWTTIVTRHPILRSTFIDSNYKGGSFDQVVVKELDDEVIEFECDDSDALGTLEEIKLCDINAERTTKLAHQVTLCNTSSGRVLFKIEMNHAIIDGGSLDILLRDLALAYNDQLPVGTGPLFSDYVKYVKGQAQQKAVGHWVEYLSGVRPCNLSLSSGSGNGKLGERMMDFKRFPELQKFCEANSVTLANLTLCAWAIVLQSVTGSDDVCFGYPSAGRDSPVPGIQDAVGIFINMLCCRVQFTPGQTLLDIAKKVQDDFIRNVPHQHCSLAQIQHELGWHGKPLFNTTLSIQNRSANKGTEKRVLEFEPRKAHDPTEYPVTVNVETTKGREGILLRYWTDSVTESQAKDLADAIAKVFACFVDEPTKLVSGLGLRNLPQNRGLHSREPIIADQLIDSYALQRIIDDRVNEIIGQMLEDGKLALPFAQGRETSYSKGSSRIKMVETDDEKDLSASIPSLTDDGRSSSDNDRRLWDLWKSTLGLSSDIIQYRSSFFQLGGDSITAMKMVSAAREEGLQLTVAGVFNNPVFEDMLVIVTPRSSTTSNAETQGENNIEKLIEVTSDASQNTTPPQDISVLRPMQLDAMSLLDVICPKIGVFKGGVADVLPVTDFQSMSIAATLFGSRWMLNYFFLDGNGPLDIRRLRESFLRVVDAFDILRTVFVCHNGQFFQVVLRKIRPEIFVEETEQSLNEYTEGLQKRDREQDPRQGEQYVQFYVVKKKNSDIHRILIRMSHAQFDGVCLPKIMTAIKLGYEGSTLPPVFSFSNYMRMLPGNITPAHYHHWTTILKGSKMTEVIRRRQPNAYLHIGAFAEQKRTIEIPSTAIGNVTLATVMQSAWAVTLAKLTAQSDVVFGLTVNGRNASVPGIETTVGPCLNILPIRVNFREHWTGLDLFRYLQDQQIANMPYESLGFREIIRNCTDWPDSTYFTTSVFHQNVDYQGQMQLDGTNYQMDGAGVVDNFMDLTLVSKSSGTDRLDVSIGYSLKSPIPAPFIAKALNMVCETVQSLIANPSVPLASPSTIRSLPSQAIIEPPKPSDAPFLSSNLNSRKMSEIVVHSDILTRAWQQVLRRNSKTSSPYQLDASFFDLGGDVMDVAQIVWILQEEGFHVRLEDLLEHHTFLGQMAVMAMYRQKAEKKVDGGVEVVAEQERPVDVLTEMAETGVDAGADTGTGTGTGTGAGSWSSLGRAMTLAKKFTKWGVAGRK
ncbi:nonribosomal peptide synthase Pes1 [Aspergillus heteromorphus CBS 117.55]|uniref:Nonribosomal peptide synthase Pes1 n=1 Tax=Aspergillus heteromorphus CBS 117.55 TaxID=1448321 RepID=A0A317W7T0_9EURO|nr:nonribosomal peptide synthase Pes1 [Aspergillus heteromorphus CBS 117.55]PWY81945.1 nonribosomal peptide synthase Pes1 [Aspergillus heteromorphus CBS 117.55]